MAALLSKESGSDSSLELSTIPSALSKRYTTRRFNNVGLFCYALHFGLTKGANVDTQTEIQFQLERREQLVRHIAMLYTMRRDVMAMVEDAEKEIDIIDRHLVYLKGRLAKA